MFCPPKCHIFGDTFISQLTHNCGSLKLHFICEIFQLFKLRYPPSSLYLQLLVFPHQMIAIINLFSFYLNRSVIHLRVRNICFVKSKLCRYSEIRSNNNCYRSTSCNSDDTNTFIFKCQLMPVSRRL